jgi:hypothetical protein
MSYSLFYAYVRDLLNAIGFIACVWLLFRLIALLNALTRYFHVLAVNADNRQPARIGEMDGASQDLSV